MSHSSIGNMTNTLIETGARHMQQCRTNFDVLLCLANGSDGDLRDESDKWGMAKDELAVNCNRHIFPDAPKTGTKYAYPSVITCLGAFKAPPGATAVPNSLPNDPALFLACYYQFMGQLDQKAIEAFVFDNRAGLGYGGGLPTLLNYANHFDGTAVMPNLTFVRPPIVNQLRQFNPVGYSVGHAYAHSGVGDTMASVQVGGLRTVINGGFEVQTGDLIQMYIPEVEANFFETNGGRKHVNITLITKPALALVRDTDTALHSTTKQRRDFYNRGNGVAPGSNLSARLKTGCFSIKPYLETLNQLGHVYYGDKMRVFARALSSARPFEPVDIMIARQSL